MQKEECRMQKEEQPNSRLRTISKAERGMLHASLDFRSPVLLSPAPVLRSAAEGGEGGRGRQERKGRPLARSRRAGAGKGRRKKEECRKREQLSGFSPQTVGLQRVKK